MGTTMNACNPEVLNGVVAKAASNIRALPKNGEFEFKVGEIVCQAVEEAGSDAAALFAVSEALTNKVPVSARNLRSMYNSYRQDRILDNAAVGLFDLMIGDPEGSACEIGERVDKAMDLCGRQNVGQDALAKLAAKLEVSSQKLAKYRDVFLVVQFGGTELANNFPSSVLCQLAKILKADGLMPWTKKEMILKAADVAAKLGLTGTQVAKVVGDILSGGVDNAESRPAIVPAWHCPPELTRGTEDQEVATDENAA